MRLIGFALLLAVGSCFHLAADSLYNFSAVNQTFSDVPLTLGFTFTANDNFTVTSLGWFDGSGAGFATPHTVGIFGSQGNLLISTVLATGTSSSLDGFFRYDAITPITLDAGAMYTLAGTSGGPADSWTVNDQVSGFSVNPEFTIAPNAALFTPSSDLVSPTTHFSDYLVYAGPNLMGSSARTATPEPETMALVPLAAIGLLFMRRRQKLSRH